LSNNGNGSTSSYATVDPDVRLMLEVRDDNAAAFEQLVVRYQDRLINVLEHLVRSKEWAEDLAQEVFLRVFRARKSYEPGAKFSTWLFTIANNVASNSRRDRARRKEVAVSATSSTESGAVPLNEMALARSALLPARQLDKLEMAEVVRIAMESLGERQRMALLLCKFENMCYQDIADTMGLTVKAVKSLLSRARVNLKSILEPYMAVGQRPDSVEPVEDQAANE
jgi:RNA polymerase sigma-70 factor (ECF subfamily)